MLPCRLIIDALPSSGAWNMAVDESLLESAVQHNTCTVRIYRWNEATLSFGYFQPAEESARNPRLADLPAVRRLTGGGAIVHHHEVTYSCCLPAGHPIASDPTALYGRIHAAIIGVLAEPGVAVRMRGDAMSGREDLFLCFGRGDRHDILIQQHKIVGSAQRRRRGAILQHGSILLRRSEYAPEYPGLSELTRRAIPPADFDRQLGERIAAALSQRRESGVLSEPERQLAQQLEAGKYRRLIWERPVQKAAHRRIEAD
jgi:lipoate-protein ligase A